MLAQHCQLVRGDQPNGFEELAVAGGPAVEEAETGRGHGHFRDADGMEDADEHETAVDFLADFLAEEGALQVGQNSGGCHRMKSWSDGAME